MCSLYSFTLQLHVLDIMISSSKTDHALSASMCFPLIQKTDTIVAAGQ